MIRSKNALAIIITMVLTVFLMIPCRAAAGSELGLDTFEEILSNIQSYHVSAPDREALIRAAIDGLIESLDDSHTQYMSDEQMEQYLQSLEGKYSGVGIMVEVKDEYPMVTGTVVNSPAWQAGVTRGDLIIRIDDLDLRSMPLDKVVQKIRGPEGTRVKLTIQRPGTDLQIIDLIRSEIENPQVSSELFPDGVGYIKINTFGSESAWDFRNALAILMLQGADKLIVDVRENPGGLVSAAVDICSNFMDPGLEVFHAVDRNRVKTEYLSHCQPIAKGMPIAVLIDQDSASASEVLAGALQDREIATLIGTRSYGKGTMQNMIDLKTDGYLILTIAQFYTPKNHIIDRVGLQPDLQVVDPNLAIIAARRQLVPPAKTTVLFEPGQSEALVDGNPVPAKPVMQRNGISYVPLRMALEGLGYQVFWHSDTNTISVSGYGAEAIVDISRGTIIVGGRTLTVPQPFLIEGGGAFISTSALTQMGVKASLSGGKIYMEKTL